MSNRPDAIGLFWQDLPKVKAKVKQGPQHWGPMPRLPEDITWTTPTEFPNLGVAKVIGVDTETKDPELTTAGPGWGRDNGHIVGVSLAVEDGSSWYFPIRHETLPEQNLDPGNVLRYLNHTLSTQTPKVGANLIYDVGWLNWEGVSIGGPLYDIQFAEALLDSEAPGVALEDLGQKYLGMGKETSFLYEWLASWNNKAINDKQRRWIYKAPPCLAGPYAEGDAALPIRILERQWLLMRDRGVLELFDLECRLIRLLVAMRMKGAPVNLDRAEQEYEELGRDLVNIERRIKDIAGQPVNPNAGDSIKAAFFKLGIEVPTKVDKKTGETKVSFSAPLLEKIEHPLVEQILEHRRVAKVRNTFVKGYILDKHVNSRVHCSFHPLKGLENGARSGRFASSDPNLQNIPVRTEMGRRVRAMFDATVFGGRWRGFDYSSVEYRLLVHFAVGPGSDEVRAAFAKDPTLDYHQFVGDLIYRLTGIPLHLPDNRGKVKGINFGIIYGMALNALAHNLKLPKPEAKKLLDAYHDAIPYARETMDMCADEVHNTGMVRTILNRASDFNQWGKKGYSDDYGIALPYKAACAKWGMYNIERQHTHKALNRKLQGSAADIMKVAMVEAYEAGLFAEDACGIPILTVHDELDFEDLGSENNPAWEELRLTMETALSDRLRVPLLVDAKTGPTWREAH